MRSLKKEFMKLSKYLMMLCAVLLCKNSSLFCMLPPNTCPAPITSGYIHVNCCDIFVELSGVDINGTIVFIHGLLQSHISWVCQRNFFCAQGYRVLTLDLRGQGVSGSVLPYNQDQWASDLAAILAVLNITNPIILAGHSLGGSVSYHYAAIFPDKVSHLVTFDSAGFSDDNPNANQAFLGLCTVARETNSLAPFSAIFPAIGFDDCTIMDPVVAAKAFQLGNHAIVGTDPQIQCDVYFQGIVPYDDRSILQFITADTLIIYGCNDQVTPIPAMITTASMIAGATIIGVVGKNHDPHYSAADFCNNLMLQFIQGVPLVSDTSCAGPSAPCSSCLI